MGGVLTYSATARNRENGKIQMFFLFRFGMVIALVRLCWFASAGSPLLVRLCWSASVGPPLLVRLCWFASAGSPLLGHNAIIKLRRGG
jgi:hypothetical protein